MEVRILKRGGSARGSARSYLVIFKDCIVVLCFLEKLYGTHLEDVAETNFKAAFWFEQGLAPIWRWTRTNDIHRTVLGVPANITAYSRFINTTDLLMSYQRSWNALKRKKTRLKTITFTWLLGLAVQKAFFCTGSYRKNISSTHQSTSIGSMN